MSAKAFKTVTISLPIAMGKEIEKVAKEERRTVSELFRESFRRYQAQRNLLALAEEGRKTVKKKKLTDKDFGGLLEV
ncbi:ribbon-helix-helix protein, CopG family [Bdellovibrionota bacterium FG-2]